MKEPVFQTLPNIVYAGRAAAGLYAILRTVCRDAEVVVPANVCPAAVYPIVYSGNCPVFCDVEAPAGNVSLAGIRDCVTDRTAAVLVPHMYGNPVQDIAAIAEFCRDRDVLLVEDCASAMGAQTDTGMVGTFGDYVLYSTGHAKVLDFGGGGFVTSAKCLAPVETVLMELPLPSDRSRAIEREYAHEYRRYLNTRKPLAEFSGRDYFQRDFREMFLIRAGEEYMSSALSRINCELPGEIDRRRRAYDRWVNMFRELVCDAGVEIYRYHPTGIPWRFSFFIEAGRRQRVADALLAAGIPVSDWYPMMTELFGDTRVYPTANALGSEILNVPLDLSDDEIAKTCAIVASSFANGKD